MRLIEVSFEVGNKVGGIHTVLASKSRLMLSLFDQYLAVGYYDPKKSLREFVEETPPDTMMPAIEAVRSLGGDVHYGSWLVPGKPKAVLIAPSRFMERANEVKYHYWEWYGVDSLRADDWFNVPAVWAYLAGVFLEHYVGSDRNTVVLAHEWLSGGALLYLRQHVPDLPTVFHTHATILGRTLANAGYDIYSMIDGGGEVDPSLAYKHFTEAKHLMERASAHAAHVFTTVSHVTAKEAKYILGREPDLVLPNGLDMSLIPPMEELSVKHVQSEKRIDRFVLAYFAPYYTIDVKKTLYFFFSGRYDIRVKGLDVLIDALALLNDRLKREGVDKNVVFFFFVAREGYPHNPDVLENLASFKTVEDYIEQYVPNLMDHLIHEIAAGRVETKDLFDENFYYDVRRLVLALKSKEGKLPPISTHVPSPDDYIASRLRDVGLNNSKDDRVKVIYYPTYVGPGDGLIGLPYYDTIAGMHLGVFPSYYEPWGYTPLETAAWGVPAVTTDVAGFGQFLKREYGEFVSRAGISVLPRRGLGDTEFVRALADVMYWVLTMPRRERLEKKIEAKYMAARADWNNMITYYLRAAELALHRASH